MSFHAHTCIAKTIHDNTQNNSCLNSINRSSLVYTYSTTEPHKMNLQHLRNLLDELSAYIAILASDLDNIGFIDFHDNLISEFLICAYQVTNLLEELRRQHNGN